MVKSKKIKSDEDLQLEKAIQEHFTRLIKKGQAQGKDMKDLTQFIEVVKEDLKEAEEKLEKIRRDRKANEKEK